MIRLTIPSIEQDDLDAVRETLASGMLVQGARVAAFERDVADYVGCKHAVAVSNCTAALHLSLLALGVGPGDAVAVTTYSWPATANVIALCGARPVFVDIQPDTYNMDPHRLAEVLARENVRAILPVHTFGQMADMPAILELADRYGIPVVEDAACALGATIHGRPAGTWGIAGCFSLHPRKAITTGEGGLITTNDAHLARQARILRNHGLDPDSPTPDFIAAGYNLRMTEFQAALGSAQMKKLDRLVEARRQGAARYDQLLAGSEITPPAVRNGAHHVYQSYVALLPQAVAPKRAEIIAALKSKGIETTIGTYHMPLTTYFRKKGHHQPGDFPVTDEISARSVSLPLYERITREDQQQVVAALMELLE
ncbi:MAG: DegT/DnrJ/EryC1/StrS family aminotransferase [Chloroflexi bacterium]|nr:DegT/DnrJ/EryC1/StrS family aminotransferase [Chloroflexota bacterium]